MDEKVSILKVERYEYEKFIECRLCNHLVGSLNPICKNCGLEMSSEGIIDFAECEEICAEIEANKAREIRNIRISVIMFEVINILAVCCNLADKKSFSLFLFGINIFSFIVGFLVTTVQLSRRDLTLEEKKKIKREKFISLVIFFFSVLIMLGIYFFLLK
jgi:hypothetical protein